MADEALHPLTNDLVDRFALALKEKLLASQIKYGWADDWARDDWQERCQASLLDHIGKGDPRDVAAFAAFMWHHGWPTTTREGMATAKLPDHAKRFLAYMCAYHRAYVNQGGVSLHSEAANDSIDEIMDLVPQEFHDLDFDIPDFGGCGGPWKCFHCNALFEDRDAAMQHFGESEDAVAACLVERAPKADSALAGEPDRNQPHPLSQIWADAFHAWENGSHWDACETLRAALSDRDVVLEANKRLQKQSDFHDEAARRMGQKLHAVVQIIQDEKRKAADIALEGGERARANESMEAALGRALNRIESELVGAADA